MKRSLELATLVDTPRLTEWLDRNYPELGDRPLGLSFLHGGTSNATIIVERGNRPAILRRPPLDAPPGSSSSMLREARMLKALSCTAVPHPYLFALCEDEAVIGAPFYLMEKVEGWSPRLTSTDIVYQPPFDSREYRHDLIYALADGLITLAGVDYIAAGLADFGKPADFLERQVKRWTTQLESYPRKYPGWQGRELPHVDSVATWLETSRPAMSPAGILHGDYGSPNCMFANAPPVRLTAILDWELSTIGDPLLDLGMLIYPLRDRRTPDIVPMSAIYDVTGLPTRQDIAEYYASRTGRDISSIDYYMVLAQYRMACILEYKVARASIGLESKEIGNMFAPLVLRLLAESKRTIDL